MAEPITTTAVTALGTVALAGAVAATEGFCGKVGEYAADKAIEAWESGWENDKQAGGISSRGNNSQSSPATA
ncbi:hypothetical protein [Nostoc sp. UHCC 0870]|uniref:hypothetical protein n=1 Tax=Nostoc sp. UHCC 0870 TaxID=2914041 RepID=UPI001EDEE460|nr:hypothetical protein [Nostoc sp. UHCC 0870]UKP01460.1 hypothetical protein L6494_30105 [Nostoc sp. UHCC 0870]